MKVSVKECFRRVAMWGLLPTAALFLYACGDGGGVDGGSGGTASLYITDDVTTNYSQVIVTIYKIELKRTDDGSTVTAFDDQQGVTYDLSELNGVLEKLGTIPSGSYNRVLVTVGEKLILVDNTGAQVSPDPSFAGNDWTNCSGGKCVMEIQGAVNLLDSRRMVLDFDLKQFIYDPITNTVKAKVVLDAGGSKYDSYYEMKEDDYELKGIIDAMDLASFDLVIKKVRHLMPSGNVVTVQVDSATVYTCDEDDDNSAACGVSALGDLQAGMKVEVYGDWNGAFFKATRVEVDYDDDIKVSPCDVPVRSLTDFSGHALRSYVEGSSYTFDSTEHSVTVSGETILITRETRIKYESGGTDRLICADGISDIDVSSIGEIEVEYFQAEDPFGNTVYVAYEIEIEEGGEG